ncbi:MAG: cyclopropane-fatty-acyl-phospholipid synthase [Acidobacteriota bacterium]|jgi:cyclopropane-fatty-acyl-phospholipid synthase
MTGLETALSLVERGYVPDWVSRQGIRRLLEKRLREESAGSTEGDRHRLRQFADQLRRSAVALHPDKANEQHYEVPPEFFLEILGKHLKYSSCYWDRETRNLDEAETRMLALTCERAGLVDGQDILELGCGWGSLTLWMARQFPSSRILAMSNSTPQREFVLERAGREGLENVQVVTCDVNEFQTELRFDRVVSVEMFEHVRNYAELMRRIAGWLRPDGKLFVHIFCHRRFAYPFETEGADNWMGRYFFTGGIMPSDDLLLHFQDDLELETRWTVDGTHYARTACAWLDRMTLNRERIDPILARVYGRQNATVWRNRWRLFFMACEELFGYRGGREWQVSHYRFRPRATAQKTSGSS